MAIVGLLAHDSAGELVRFRHRNPAAGDVYVAGEFNGWSVGADRMSAGPDGLWTLEKDLPAGTYAYKLVVDDQWILDPENPATKVVDNTTNSLLDTSDSHFSSSVDLSVPRTWTSKSGNTLVARVVDISTNFVVLEKAGGGRVRIGLDALADADRRLVAVKTSRSSIATSGIKKGVIDRYPLTARMFEKTSDYFKGSTRRNMERWYTNRDRIDAELRNGAYDPEQPLRYDLSAEGASVYIPPSYDATTNWGLFVHVDPGDGSTIKDDWKEVMDQRRFLYACPWGAENGKPDMRRVGLALDTIATMRKDYVINPRRIVISGLSGGGYAAFQTALLYPEYFHGAISHAAQIYINGHYPYMAVAEFGNVARRPTRWAIVSGEQDKNYKEIVTVSRRWRQMNFDFRFFDVPGMGHHVASGEWLDKILRWIDGEAVPGAEPREK